MCISRGLRSRGRFVASLFLRSHALQGCLFQSNMLCFLVRAAKRFQSRKMCLNGWRQYLDDMALCVSIRRSGRALQLECSNQTLRPTNLIFFLKKVIPSRNMLKGRCKRWRFQRARLCSKGLDSTLSRWPFRVWCRCWSLCLSIASHRQSPDNLSSFYA